METEQFPVYIESLPEFKKPSFKNSRDFTASANRVFQFSTSAGGQREQKYFSMIALLKKGIMPKKYVKFASADRPCFGRKDLNRKIGKNVRFFITTVVELLDLLLKI